jgi:hypothetical protein
MVFAAEAPALAVDLQYDPGPSNKLQAVRELDIQTRICMRSAILSVLREGLRDRDSLIDYAVMACGGLLQRMLMSGYGTDPMTAESSRSYLQNLASVELSKIPGISDSAPAQGLNADVAVPPASTSRSMADMANELTQAPKIAIAVIRKRGILGLIKEISDCYKSGGKANEMLFKCVYLDIAARHIDQIAAEALHTSINPFFQDSKFGARIGPVLQEAHMDVDGANRYLRSISAAIRKIADAELDEHPL